MTTLAVNSPTRVLIQKYDRSGLRAHEVEALADVAARKGGGAWAPNAPRALARLVVPIYDAINRLHLITDGVSRRGNEHSYARFRLRCTWPILRQVHLLGRTYWEWSEPEWCTLIAHGRKDGRVPVSAVAYVLCGSRPHLPARLRFSYSHLYKVIFGQAAWDQIEAKITNTLAGWGYAVGRSNNGYLQTLAILLLDGHATCLEDLSRQLLEAHLSERGPALRYVRPIALALHHFGIIDRPLRMPPGPNQAPPWDGVATEWHALICEWQARATYSPSQVGRVLNTGWKVGQWLAENHPDVTRPEQWTPELAAHFLRSVMDWTTGQYLPDHYFPNALANPARRGKPMATNTKIGIVSTIRVLFRDLARWRLVGPLQIEISQDLAAPKALVHLRGPNPRDIRQAVWMKLVWASLNLTHEDCPQPSGSQARFQPGYSPTLLRAAAVLWTHAGLRTDELSRLEIGCVRELTPGMDPELQEELDHDVADLVCLLSVPANKTSGAFTKPVGKVVAQYVKALEAVRGEQPIVLDRKTRQPTQYLFMHRGRKLGQRFVNGVLIPLLCRKAGVPLEDVPGKKITSHRGRASLATWYYNTREGMSLEELQRWLGHAELRSTEQYVRPSPIRLAKKFARAHANSYVMEVLVDTDAVTSGAVARGAAWQYYPLGNGDFCTNPFYAACPHRMACARCEFHLPAESQVASALVAKKGLQHMLLEMPLDEEERAAVEGGVGAMDALIARRRNVPTPDGRTPAQINASARPPSFIPLTDLAG